MASKATSYRFSEATSARIEKLSDRFESNRTELIDAAIYNLALQEGILDEEAHDRFDELLHRHGDDATITFAIVQNNTAVPVSINGKPTQEIRAHRMLVHAYWVSQGPPTIDPNAEHPVIAVIPNSGITFDLGRIAAPQTIEMPLTEFFAHRNAFQPRTSHGAIMSRDVRRSAGVELPEDDDDE